MAEDPRRWLVDRFGDIANIEVNTVESEISARKPPPWPDALKEIAENFIQYVKENRRTRHSQTLPIVSKESIISEVFISLRDITQNEIGHPGTVSQASSKATRIVFFRIRKACDQIIDILTSHELAKDSLEKLERQKTKIDPDARICIRKIWELGTNRVVLQTVMQLDGDIVSRIASQRTQKDELLMQLHKVSLGQSITYWNMVLTLIIQFARRWFGRRS